VNSPGKVEFSENFPAFHWLWSTLQNLRHNFQVADVKEDESRTEY